MTKFDIKYFGESFTGRRSNNQDTYLCKQLNENTFCFAIADGMGGANFGEIASKIVIQDVELFLSNIFSDNPEKINLKKILEDCFYYVQDRFVEYMEENTEHSGMGTTLVVLLIHERNYVCGNIGDSRLYRIIDEEIEQLTVDHTYLQHLKESGSQIDDAINSNYSHLLTKCINGGTEKPDIFPVEEDHYTLEEPTGFILCSDGLILDKSEVSNDQIIKEIFVKENKLFGITGKLIDYAYSSGSGDNITAVIVRCGTWVKKKNNRSILVRSFALIMVLLVLTSLYLKNNSNVFNKGASALNKQVLSDKGSKTLSKGKINWRPLDTADLIPKSPSSYIVWSTYPNAIQVRNYCVTLLDSAKNVVERKKIKGRIQFLRMDAFEKVIFSKKYYISVDAELKDGSVIKGNSISVQTNNSK